MPFCFNILQLQLVISASNELLTWYLPPKRETKTWLAFWAVQAGRCMW